MYQTFVVIMHHNFMLVNGLTNMVVGKHGKLYCMFVRERLVDLVLFAHTKGQDLHSRQVTNPRPPHGYYPDNYYTPHCECGCPKWGRTLLQKCWLKRDCCVKTSRVYVCDHAYLFVLPLGCIFILNSLFGITFLPIFRHPNLTLCLEKIQHAVNLVHDLASTNAALWLHYQPTKLTLCLFERSPKLRPSRVGSHILKYRL